LPGEFFSDISIWKKCRCPILKLGDSYIAYIVLPVGRLYSPTGSLCTKVLLEALPAGRKVVPSIIKYANSKLIFATSYPFSQISQITDPVASFDVKGKKIDQLGDTIMSYFSENIIGYY